MFLNWQKPATNSRLSPLNPEPVDYNNYGFGETVDIPLDTSTVCIQLRLFPIYDDMNVLFQLCDFSNYFFSVSTLGFEKEGEGTPIQGGWIEKKGTGIQWDFLVSLFSL